MNKFLIKLEKSDYKYPIFMANKRNIGYFLNLINNTEVSLDFNYLPLNILNIKDFTYKAIKNNSKCKFLYNEILREIFYYQKLFKTDKIYFIHDFFFLDKEDFEKFRNTSVNL